MNSQLPAGEDIKGKYLAGHKSCPSQDENLSSWQMFHAIRVSPYGVVRAGL